MTNNTITAPKGFLAAGVHCGIKKSGKADLALLVCPAGAKAAAVFTTNKITSAAVQVSKRHIKSPSISAVVVNSGNANACTGQVGIKNAIAMCAQTAKQVDVADPHSVLVASTGIIGEQLPVKKIAAGISKAAAKLSDSAKAGLDFAKAIMTTDTKPKQAIRQIKISGNQATIAGAIKAAGIEPTKLYLRANGTLAFAAAPTGEGSTSDSYVSDPSQPVPFSAEERTTLGHLWKVEDQRFASSRSDVLVYQSEVLEEDLTVAGPILAEIFVSTTGTDSDWVVKLIDVYPDDAPDSESCDVPMGGFQMHLAGEIMRGRFRNSFEEPEAMVTNEVTPIRIDLRDRYHTFKAGHQIMVHVQSSWFPAYDRNPQTFVDPYHARGSDYQTATQTVYRSAQYPSHLVLGVLK